MSSFSASTPVGEFVALQPGLSRVFQQHGIDFCCGGKRPLEDACREKGLNTDDLLREIHALGGNTQDELILVDAPLTEICDHIEATHHAFLRTEMPRLAGMAAKVSKSHGQNHPEMLMVERLFNTLHDELGAHMLKEERVLFPGIRAMEAGDASACSHCGSVANPISVMEHEHDSAGEALAQLRKLTRDFTPPNDACNTFRALLDGLRGFEENMHQHVHKENSILFPRAIALEKRLRV